MTEDALLFDGIDDYATLLSHSSLQLNVNKFTVACWVYPKTSGISKYLICKGDHDYLNGDWLLQILGNNFEFKYFIGGVDTSIAKSPTWTDAQFLNHWLHVVFVHDSTLATKRQKMFVNGWLVGSGNNANDPDATINNLCIGNRLDLDRNFEGILDEIHIIKNEAVTYATINEWYNQRIKVALRDATSALFHLDEGSGNHGNDDSLNAHVIELGGAGHVAASMPAWNGSGYPTTIPTDKNVATLTGGADRTIRLPKSHKIIWMANRLWLFYSQDSLATGSVCYSVSEHGYDFGEPVILWTGVVQPAWADFYFDGTYLHYCRCDSLQNNLYYRRGIPASDGTITWSAAEQTVIGDDSHVDDPQIIVDTNGYVWIAFADDSGPTLIKIYKNSATDGTWTDASGYPQTLYTCPNTNWTCSLIPLTGGKIYAIMTYSNTAQVYDEEIIGKLYNGTSWGDAETVSSSYIDATDWVRFSATSYKDYVYLAFLARAGAADHSIRFIQRHPTGGWGSEEVVDTLDAGTSTPVLSANDNRITVFWAEADSHIYYRQRKLGGSWDSIVDWIDKSEYGLVETNVLNSGWKRFPTLNQIGIMYHGNILDSLFFAPLAVTVPSFTSTKSRPHAAL